MKLKARYAFLFAQYAVALLLPCLSATAWRCRGAGCGRAPIWARFYDLETEAPIFCTRQRKITRDYTEVSRERRTGYSWYGYYPANLLAEDYPAWKQRRQEGERVGP